MIRRVCGRRPRRGVEIGVFRGETSQELLCWFPNTRMVLVDLWREFPEGDQYREKHGYMGRYTQEEWDAFKQEAIERTKGYRRVYIHQCSSEEASKKYDDGMFSFAFLDGNHTYEGTLSDIRLWLPKVKKGGLICGHDYHIGKPNRFGWGVRQAVLEMFEEERVMVKPGRIWGVRV